MQRPRLPRPSLVAATVAIVLLLLASLPVVVGRIQLASDGGAAAVTLNTAQAGPKMWQEKEPPAYNTVPRMGDVWRSVAMPPAHQVEELLREGGKLPLNASPAEIERAVADWYKKARREAYTGPDPLAFRQLMEREQELLSKGAETASPGPNLNAAEPPEDDFLTTTPPKDLLAVVVEFDGTDTISRTYPISIENPISGCTTVTQTFGPVHLGDDPPPGPRDNFNFYKAEGFTVADYESAFFGEGPDAGYGVVREDLGGIDLSGFSLQNYLLEMSGDLEYRAGGSVLEMPVSVPHAPEYYGYARYSEDDDGECVAPTFSDANYREYAPDVIDAVVAQYGDSIDWSEYDADGDHVVDLLVTIHAGYAFQNGGGEDRLSTSSSSFIQAEITDLPQIGGLSTPDDPSDDYYVRGYNVDPEQLDVGAIQEEFEHQFGLPDIYTTDGSANSNAWWGAHSSGVWGGPLGGTRPVGHNLWQDWVLGWRDPMIVNYDDPAMEVTLGRARYTPEDTEDGLIVKLPPEQVEVLNRAGEGVGWWSDSGDLMDNRVTREFDLTGATGQVIFSFDASWDIEEDWDYGFVEVSTDGGDTWETLPDMDGVLRDTNPNGNNLGWGLTGSGDANLRFDLSDYAGETIMLRLRYLTDPAVSNPGWWVDNLLLEDDSGVLYANDLEEDFSDWTNEGWIVVPFTQVNERFYTAEWRDDNGFDESLNDPYYPVYDSPTEPPPEFEVDRLPATTPGMQISIRNTGEGFDYTLFDDLNASPSYGPKLGLITVDSHFEAVRFDTKFDDFQDGWVGYTMYGRTKSGNALFGTRETNEWTARLGFDVDTGTYQAEPLEEKTWDPMPPVPAFHDSYGYYPGFYYPGGQFVYLHDSDSSAAIPAKGDYSTRITDLDGNPLLQLYGVGIGPGPGLGTGNPGDDLVQYGVHLEVVQAAADDSWGRVRFWNKPFEVKLDATAGQVVGDGQAGEVSFQITENIGGRLDNLVAILEVPSNTKYIWSSASDGCEPVVESVGGSAQAVADYIAANGLEALATQSETIQQVDPTADNVHYVACHVERVGTRQASGELGFAYMADAPAGGTAEAQIYLFNDYLEQFQVVNLPTVLIEPVARYYLPFVGR